MKINGFNLVTGTLLSYLSALLSMFRWSWGTTSCKESLCLKSRTERREPYQLERIHGGMTDRQSGCVWRTADNCARTRVEFSAIGIPPPAPAGGRDFRK